MITPAILNGQRVDLTALSKLELTLEQLNAALRSVYDHWFQTPYLLFGDTAKGAKEGMLYGEKIELGIRKLDLTRDIDLKFMYDRHKTEYVDISENIMKYTYDRVPIEVKIIHRKYQLFRHPDTIGYNYDLFKIPNPFEKYYKARYIIK